MFSMAGKTEMHGLLIEVGSKNQFFGYIFFNRSNLPTACSSHSEFIFRQHSYQARYHQNYIIYLTYLLFQYKHY